jgi:threonine dehydratase
MARWIDLAGLVASAASDPAGASDPAAEPDPDPNPFVRYRTRLHAYHVARAAGWSDARYVDLVRRLDDAVAAVDEHGFRATPVRSVPALARAAGLGPGGRVWVKDETRNVGGSHKARHLFGILLELQVAEAIGTQDPSAVLAIASCGNAALAAAIVARAAGRTLRVFVPEDADPSVLARLDALDALVTTCPRRPGETGDPAYLRLQEAIADGAVPFTCQGPDNGLAIEGGATIAWELLDAVRAAGESVDRMVIQVGGGALTSGIALGCREAVALDAISRAPRMDTVQTQGAWPLRRAHTRLLQEIGAQEGEPLEAARVDAALREAAAHRSRFMRPWETTPVSVAHGILDDETYDWLAVERAMLVSGGRALVVDETALVEANALACAATGIDADETGTAGVAGLLALGAAGHLGTNESIAVVLSGVRRAHPAEE